MPPPRWLKKSSASRQGKEGIAMQHVSRHPVWRWLPWLAGCAVLAWFVSPSLTQPPGQQGKNATGSDREKGPLKTSYDQVSPVLLGQESYAKMLAKDKADKESVMAR